MRRFAIALTTLVVGLAVPGTALAAPPVVTTAPSSSDIQGASIIQVDKVLAKLNTLEDKLDASTAKVNALTVKLDATTAKLDAPTLRPRPSTTRCFYTKGYVQGGFTNLQEQLRRTCGVADEARALAAYAALDSWFYARIFACVERHAYESCRRRGGCLPGAVRGWRERAGRARLDASRRAARRHAPMGFRRAWLRG